MSRLALITGGVLGAVAVLLGAFGAHVLRSALSPQALAVYGTGVRYLHFHVLALLGTALLIDRFPEREPNLKWVAAGFIAGCFLFSGSLVTLSLTGWSWFGMVTPVGGVAWVAAWLGLAYAFVRKPRS